MQALLKWLGLRKRAAKKIMPEENDTTKPPQVLVNTLRHFHLALDNVYGEGFSEANPNVVARFMLAASMQALAEEVRGIRETLNDGTGAITVGVENAAPH